MQLFFATDAEYDVYKKYYYPMLQRHGFSWQLFPELKIYLELKYPYWNPAQPNINLEHYNPDLMDIFVRMITPEEAKAAGFTDAQYAVMQKAMPSSLIHEIFHHIQWKYFGADGGPIWKAVCALAGVVPNFTVTTAGQYISQPTKEQLAEYFKNCIRGLTVNESFLSYIRDLVGLTAVTVHPSDYLNVEGRTFLPVRKVAEALGFQVEYDTETKDVYIFNHRDAHAYTEQKVEEVL